MSTSGIANSIALLPAVAEDSDFIWQVRNLAEVREASLDQAFIPRQMHQQFFTPAQHEYLIVMAGNQAVGYLRVAEIHRPELAELSVALIPEARGRGWGSETIRQGIAEARSRGFQTVRARIKPGNDASQMAFLRAGFRQVYQVWEVR